MKKRISTTETAPSLSILLGTLLAGNLPAENIAREQLDKLLAELAARPAPEKIIHPGAACYDSAEMVKRTEYVCSKCGDKKLFAENSKLEKAKDEEYHRWGLSEVRELKLDAALKRRGVCEACAKEAGLAAETFGFYADITLNGTTTRTLLRADDWEKLIAFLKGEDFWEKEHRFVSTEWVTDG